MSDFSNFLSPGRKGHLVGIGGVSMSSLAEVLQGMGISVSGSDSNESHNVRQLREKGIPVSLGHRAENIPADADFLVRTAAVHDDNPEIAFARAHDIPVFERTEAWGAISRDYRNALCISGTHGKTTTTSMCTHILMAADRDPTVMIGGTLPLLNAGHLSITSTPSRSVAISAGTTARGSTARPRSSSVRIPAARATCSSTRSARA